MPFRSDWWFRLQSALHLAYPLRPPTSVADGLWLAGHLPLPLFHNGLREAHRGPVRADVPASAEGGVSRPAMWSSTTTSSPAKTSNGRDVPGQDDQEDQQACRSGRFFLTTVLPTHRPLAPRSNPETQGLPQTPSHVQSHQAPRWNAQTVGITAVSAVSKLCLRFGVDGAIRYNA